MRYPMLSTLELAFLAKATPTTSPFASNAGPPEFPPLIAASIWTESSRWLAL